MEKMWASAMMPFRCRGELRASTSLKIGLRTQCTSQTDLKRKTDVTCYSMGDEKGFVLFKGGHEHIKEGSVCVL